MGEAAQSSDGGAPVSTIRGCVGAQEGDPMRWKGYRYCFIGLELLRSWRNNRIVGWEPELKVRMKPKNGEKLKTVQPASQPASNNHSTNLEASLPDHRSQITDAW